MFFFERVPSYESRSGIRGTMFLDILEKKHDLRAKWETYLRGHRGRHFPPHKRRSTTQRVLSWLVPPRHHTPDCGSWTAAVDGAESAAAVAASMLEQAGCGDMRAAVPAMLGNSVPATREIGCSLAAYYKLTELRGRVAPRAEDDPFSFDTTEAVFDRDTNTWRDVPKTYWPVRESYAEAAKRLAGD